MCCARAPRRRYPLIDRRDGAPDDPLRTEEAVLWLMETAKFKRSDARAVTRDETAFAHVKGAGRGAGSGCPIYLRPRYTNGSAAEKPKSPDPCVYADSGDPVFRRPHAEHTAEKDLTQTRVNAGDFETPFSAADASFIPGKAAPANVAQGGKTDPGERFAEDLPEGKKHLCGKDSPARTGRYGLRGDV